MCKKLNFTEAQIFSMQMAAVRRTRYCSKGTIIHMMGPILDKINKPSIESAWDIWAALLKAYPEHDIRYGRVKDILKELYPPVLKYRKLKRKPAFTCGPTTHCANAWAFIIS